MMRRRAVVRRRPLLRTAAVGGMGYMAGRAAASRSDATAGAAQDDFAQQPTTTADPTTGATTTGATTTGAPGPSAADQLSQLNTLHQQGALTDEEFAAAKAKILGG
jgi:hypothetical protein